MINIDPLSTNPTKWSNTLKQFVGYLPTNCLSVFDHFVGLALKGLKNTARAKITTSTVDWKRTLTKRAFKEQRKYLIMIFSIELFNFFITAVFKRFLEGCICSVAI